MTSDWLVKEPQSIVVRMPNWVGDCVMATPILTDLRRRFPSAQITVMCHEKLAKLFEHDEDIDEVFSFTYPNGWLPRLRHRDLVARLRAGEYDLGILLTNSFTSAWWFWEGRVRWRLGYKGHWRRFLLTKAVEEPATLETQHLVLTYKMLLAPLGISLSNSRPRIHLLPREVEMAREMLAKQGVPIEARIIGINPGAAFGTAKCWLPERFRAVTELLLQDPRNYIIYFGDATGSPLVKRICSGLSDHVLNLAGATNLRELVALIQLCDVLLTNDSGPMHIAAAVETPLVALFGSTSDVQTGPYGKASVIHKHVSCSPCYKVVCPIDFRCMTQISVEEVYQNIQALLPD